MLQFLLACLQISYRLFDLTNTLKIAFVPSKDDKRLVNNIITATAISCGLYFISFVFLKIPQMLVSFTPLNWLISVRFTLSKMSMSANHSLALKAENLLMEMHVLTSILVFNIAFL